MLTMKIVRLLGIAGVMVLAAACLAAHAQRRRAEQQRLDENIQDERWEGEGGATPTGPATPSATAH